MDEAAIQRARARLDEPDSTAADAALERARTQLEELAETTAKLQTRLPDSVSEAVREGVRAEALPVARQLAEVRGLAGHLVRRFERHEGDFLAERRARVEDLAVLIDLITSGWKAVDERLARLEATLAEADLVAPQSTNGAPGRELAR